MGGSRPALEGLEKSPGFIDLWQLHFSPAAGERNAPDEFIANPGVPCDGKCGRIGAVQYIGSSFADWFAGEWVDMKAITAVALMTMGLAVSLMAETFAGVVMDQKCSGNASMKSNTDCIQKCIKEGSPAVLVTADGKVYKIANQDKILASAGKNVSVDGKLDKDTITVATVADAK
jgi:hypothetical protein